MFSLDVSMCTHPRQVEHQRCCRTRRVQKIQKNLRKNTIFNEHPVSLLPFFCPVQTLPALLSAQSFCLSVSLILEPSLYPSAPAGAWVGGPRGGRGRSAPGGSTRSSAVSPQAMAILCRMAEHKIIFWADWR